MRFLYSSQLKGHEAIGAKAKGLIRLQEEGFKVPDWGVIPADLLFEDISGNETDLKTKIRQFGISDAFIKDVISNFKDTRLWSVRSSAEEEDGHDFSFAGQFDTYLYVSAEKLAERIKDVWLSAYSDRIIQYRKINHLPAASPV